MPTGDSFRLAIHVTDIGYAPPISTRIEIISSSEGPSTPIFLSRSKLYVGSARIAICDDNTVLRSL